jgi:general L-amino acid transport system permease protein
MATVVPAIRSPRTSVGVWGWLKQNLFSPWYNAVLTIVTLWALWVVGTPLAQWFVNAKWQVIIQNLRLFMVGPYPPDQTWRVWLVVTMVSFLAGWSGAIWGATTRNIAMGLAASFALLALWSFFAGGYEWHVVNLFVVMVAYGIARATGKRIRWQRWVSLGWLVSFFLTLILLHGIDKNPILPLVGTDKWGGLLLTFLLALVSIVVSFPLGVLLALGRRSKLPIVSLFSTLYIELVRGVPLVTILFMAQIMIPLFFPEELRLDRILRAMGGMTLFAAAYMAENVRGGLQAIPEGQIEAAKAVGLNNAQTTLLVVLPQALRISIPLIVNLFIGLFKDTTLVTIVGLLDLLAIGKSVVAQPEFLGRQTEVYIFIAGVFFVFCWMMSYASSKLEEALGVGKR